MSTGTGAPISFGIPEADLIALEQLRVFAYLQFAGTIILIYDYAITFFDEVELIWSQKRNLATAIFYFVRYFPFVDTVFLFYQQFSHNPTISVCHKVVSTKAWLYIVGIAAANAVLNFRTYIIWGNNKIVAVLLAALLLCVFAGAGYFTASYLRSLVYIQTISPSAFPGCFLIGANNQLWITYVFAGSYELGIILFTSLRVALRHKYTKGSLLFRTVTWDGITFYIFMIAMSVLNITINLVTPQPLQASFTSIHRSVHAILSVRLILNIRKVALQGSLIGAGSMVSGTGLQQDFIELKPLSPLSPRSFSDQRISFLPGSKSGSLLDIASRSHRSAAAR